MSFFNRNFFVGMVAGAIALGTMGVIGLVVVFTIISASMGGSGLAVAGMAAPAFPASDDPIMPWPVTDLDGNELDLADVPERIVFVNMWATWCGPCVVEMPSIENLATAFEDEDMAFLIVSSEPHATVAPFVEEQGWDLPVYTTKQVPPVFQTHAIPTTFVLDDGRRIVLSHVGSASWDDDSSFAFFDELLASGSPLRD